MASGVAIPYWFVQGRYCLQHARLTEHSRVQLEKYFDVVWPGSVFTRVFTILDFSFNGWHFRIAILLHDKLN